MHRGMVHLVLWGVNNVKKRQPTGASAPFFCQILFRVGKKRLVTDMLLQCCILTHSHLFQNAVDGFVFKANSVFLVAFYRNSGGGRGGGRGGGAAHSGRLRSDNKT